VVAGRRANCSARRTNSAAAPHQLLVELPIHHELLGHQTLPLLGG
jgi:hypothetical protein